MKIRPVDPNPTAPTGKLEIGERARVWADLTNEGRSWRRFRSEFLAIDSASEDSITNLDRSIFVVDDDYTDRYMYKFLSIYNIREE